MKGFNGPFFPDGLPALPNDAKGHAGPAPSPVAVRPRPPATGGAPDVFTLVRAVRNRWLLAVTLGTVAASALGLAAWRFVPRPKFTAHAVVEVKSEKPNLLPGTGQGRPDLKVFQSTQLSLIRSRLVLNAALERPGIADLPTLRTKPVPADWIDDTLVAEFPSGSELMSVSLSGDERPADLAALVNAVCEAYLEEVVTKDYNERRAAAVQLKDLLDGYNAEVTAKRAKLRGMAETVGSDDPQTLAVKQQMAVQQLGEEKRTLLAVQTDLKRLKAELTVLKESDEGDESEGVDSAEVEAMLEREPAVENYRLQISQLMTKLDRARHLVRNETDPSVRDIKRALERARRDEAETREALRPKIERELRGAGTGNGQLSRTQVVADLQRRIKSQTVYEKLLNEGIERLESEGQVFNRNTIDLQWLKDEIAQGEEISRQLGKQLESLNVELRAPQRGRLIERAESPRMESQKKRLAAIGLATMAAFATAVMGVAWGEYRLRRVGSPDEVANGLGLRLIGTLPALPGPSAPRQRPRPVRQGGPDTAAFADGGRWRERLIESIDAARTVILRDCRTEALRTILITSAAKGEGKSSLSGHLAISLARTGRRTLLVDFDLRNPSAHRLFDLEQGPGAGELLRGEAEIDDVYHVVSDDLDVITAGQGDAKAVRALGQDVLPDLLARLAERYEFVIIDSAPLLPVADSLLISQHVDAVLLSVYRDVSRIPTVFAGYERLTSLGVRVLGAVVTGMPAESYGAEYQYAAPRGV